MTSEPLEMLVVEPLLLSFELLYQGFYTICGNYITSIFLLSLITMVILWRFYVLLDRRITYSNQIRKLKQAPSSEGLGSGVDIRKRFSKKVPGNCNVFTQKVFLHLLIQLPFLLGAYWMFSSFEPLTKVPFGPIKDIAKPDHLLWGVNVLPFIMMFAGVVNAFIDPKLSGKERIQTVAINLLFCVLLYNASTAFLLYWTTISILFLIKTLSQKYYHSIPRLSFKWSTLISLYLLSFFLCLLTSTKSFGNFSGYYNLLRLISDVFFIALILCFCHDLIKKYLINKQINILIFLIAVLLISTFCLFRVGFYWMGLCGRHNLSTQLFLFSTLYVGTSLLEYCNKAVKNRRIGEYITVYNSLYYPAGALIVFLVTIFFPVKLVSSDPGAIDHDLLWLGINQVIWFGFGILLLFLFYKLTPQRTKFVFSLFIGFCCVLAIIYGLLFNVDYGSLQFFAFEKTQTLIRRANKWNDAIIILGVAFVFYLLTLIKKVYFIRNFIFLIFYFSLTLTGFNIYKIYDATQNYAEYKTGEIPSNVKNFFSFSQSGKNIVVIMLDAFTGGNMKEILEIEPALANELDGFIWYPDTISAGNGTLLGKPGILGGEEGHPLILNLDKANSLEEKINKSWGSFLSFLQKKGFQVSLHDYMWLRPEILNKYIIHGANLSTNYFIWDGLPRHLIRLDLNGRKLVDFGSNSVWRNFLNIFGFFEISPLSLRKYIYGNGHWMGSVRSDLWVQKHYSDEQLQLSSFLALSSVKTVGSYFMFAVSMATHYPWVFNKECEPCNPRIVGNCGTFPVVAHNSKKDYSGLRGWDYIPKNRRTDGTLNEHLMSEICSLKSIVKWINWMKHNKVYDNTEIILVSDHGHQDSSQLIELFDGHRLDQIVHGLFLYKPFGSTGKLIIDGEKLVANWDVPKLVKSSLEGGNTIPEWENKSRERCNVMGLWNRSQHGHSQYNLQEIWCVQGKMLSIKNWKKIK